MNSSESERGLIDINHEQEQLLRRDLINTLVVDYLHQLSPTLSEEEIENRLWSQGNILTGNISEVRSKEKVELSNLTGYYQAVGIARFYWDHPEKSIPDRVVILGKEKDPEKLIERDEKVLFVLNNYTADRDRKHDVMTFDGEKKERLRRITVPRPDIYIENLYGFLGYKPVFGLLPDEKMCQVKDISLTGADNVIIDGLISGKGSYNIGDNFSVSIDCGEDIVILPGAIVGVGEKDNISLSARGNIYQLDNSTVRALRINCDTYIQKGGTIECPESYKTTNKVVVTCMNEFQALGGTRPHTNLLEIRDGDEATRKIQTMQEIFDAKQLPSPEE